MRDLGASLASVIMQGATTLISADGQYANLYDNFWSVAGQLPITGQGILRFPVLLGMDHEKACDLVSDHAPVYIGLNGAELLPKHAINGRTISPCPLRPDCIDINASGPPPLNSLAADVIQPLWFRQRTFLPAIY